jgi:hypothetical protein
MMAQSLRRPIGRGVIYGAIGGFVGGLVMYAIMSGVMEAIGMGANCFAVILALISGQPFSNSLVPIGVAIHLITSTVIGAIFGVVISSINKLRITGFARGLGFGVATGLIAFVILFLPIALIAMPPKMMDLEKMMNSQMMMPGGSNGGKMSSSNAGMGEKSTMTTNAPMNTKPGMMSGGGSSAMSGQMMNMPDMAKMQSMIIGGSLSGHFVYGAVLGSVVTVLLIKTRSTLVKR